MKLSRILLSTLAIATIAACGNSSKVTPEGNPEFADENGVQVPQLVWPNIDKSTFSHDGSQFGSWPNWDNVRMIERGMTKDQIRQLVGNPHFSEGLYSVEEWDYVFNYRENGEHKICQYKVLFDKNHNAQNFYWYPNSCNGNSAFTLSGDFLFDFDKDNLSQGAKGLLTNISEQLKAGGMKEINISGYTDSLGSDAYNLNLSQRRAEVVKSFLVEQGVNAQITAVGYGKYPQVKACDGVPHGKALKDCLSPNRRIEIKALGSTIKAQTSTKINGGTQGPSILYKK